MPIYGWRAYRKYKSTFLSDLRNPAIISLFVDNMDFLVVKQINTLTFKSRSENRARGLPLMIERKALSEKYTESQDSSISNWPILLYYDISGADINIPYI